MIAWTIYITFAGAIVLLVLPRVFARWIALVTAAAGFAVSLATFDCVDVDLVHFTTIVRLPWVPALGMNYHLALDGISLALVLVTGIVALSSVLFSWDVIDRANEFFFWLLLVVGGSYGVFLSADLFLLFLFYELVIVPKYFLIAIFGSTNKEYGAMKLTLYSFFGGALVFLGIVAVYVSVSLMGFVLLGLATANVFGVSAAVLQMFSHGVIGALLFAVAGRMIYRRTHTRELDALAGMNLRHALPFAAFTFVIASAASMGIPGLSGFAAEITILIGAWKSYPLAVWITGAGMVLVATFTLRALKLAFFDVDGESATPSSASAARTDARQMPAPPAQMTSSAERSIHLEPITIPEKLGASLLMFATLAVGLYPKFLVDRIQPAVEAMRFLK